MKILSLDLMACGPFTNRSLDWSAGEQGLHIIYGPNEAGKTSCLRALGYWLFGFPPRGGDDDFLHPRPALRVGGVLQTSDGSRIACVRRANSAASLRDADNEDKTIDPAGLTALLGNIDKESFMQRYAIDHKRLLAGGEAVAKGKGELGELLFQAGAGLTTLTSIRAKLASDADEIFKKRATTSCINVLLNRLKKTRERLRDSQLPGSLWQRRQSELSSAESRRSEIDAALVEQRSQRQRLERILRARPDFTDWRRFREHLIPLTDARRLPAEFTSRRQEAMQQSFVASGQIADLEAELHDVQRQLDELVVPQELLAATDEIDGLNTERGVDRQAATDRPLVASQVELLKREIQARMQRLGQSAATSEQLRLPGVGTTARVGELATQFTQLTERRDQVQSRLEKLRRQAGDAQAQLDRLPAVANLEALRLVLRQARAFPGIDDHLTSVTAEVRRLEDEQRREWERLAGYGGTVSQFTVAEFDTLPLPSLEMIEEHETAQREAAAALCNAESRRKDLAEQRGEKERSLAAVRLGRNVPTPEQLAEARQRRDEAWKLVRRAWQEGVFDLVEVRALLEASSTVDLAEAYEEAVEQADAAADLLLQEADFVSRTATLELERAQLLEREAQAEQQRLAAAAVVDAATDRWRAIWLALGITARSPREMRSWLARGESFRSLAGQWRKKQDEARLIEEKVVNLRTAFAACGLTADTLLELIHRAESAIDAADLAQRKRDELTRDAERFAADASDAQNELDRADEQLRSWTANWRRATETLGISVEATPAEAVATLNEMKEVMALFSNLEEKSQRVRDMDQHREQFMARVAEVTRRVADDLGSLEPADAVVRLVQRVSDARTAQSRRNDFARQRDKLAGQCEAARETLRSAGAILTMLCQEAGCESADELPTREQRSAARQECETRIDEIESRLAHLSAGASIEAFAEEAESLAADELPQKIEQISATIERLEKERDELIGTIATLQAELNQMDGNAVAAEARQEQESILAQLADEGEEYVRLRLSTVVLTRAIEQYRQRSQGPLLTRASEHFAEMTCDRYHRLVVDVDGRGSPVLLGVRGIDEHVGVDGMSNGTRDQLYLALRLASLEHELAHREPIPFIVDDILQQFDDDRAAAALRALARLSETTQVLFFTHHEHLVRLAEETLDADVVFVHRLGRSESAGIKVEAV